MKKITFVIYCLLIMVSLHVHATDIETATDAVRNMGVGWNLGNTLDANIQSVTDITQNGYWGQQDLKSETCWGQYVTKASLMQMLKNAGFGAIRVPVTWYNHIDSEGNVDAAWMARVHEVVDYVINTGMYCIINVHHDTGADGSNFKSWVKADEANFTANKDRYEKLWKQIAEEFKDYDQKLLFEGYNEMLDKINSWCFASFAASGQYDAKIASSAYNAINNYAQSFVSTVRATGGNNAQRNLIITTYAASCGSGNWNSHLKDPLTNMKMPAGESNHIIFEVHDYPNIENLTSAKTELDEMIKSLNTNLVKKGAPVIIGEWGTSNVDKGAGMTDYDLRKADMFSFVDYFVKQCKANNIGTFYWMGLSSGISRLYPAFDQSDLALKILQAYHGTSHNPILPTKEDYSDACISVTVNYTSQWAEINLFTGSATASNYSGIELELESVPAVGELQYKVYPTEQSQDITTANSKLTFTTDMNTITRVTLQWKKATNGSTRIKSIRLVKKDGTKESSDPSVFWGCNMSDVDVITGISALTINQVDNGFIYNLHGQRLLSPSKGIYIQGHKKFIRK